MSLARSSVNSGSSCMGDDRDGVDCARWRGDLVAVFGFEVGVCEVLRGEGIFCWDFLGEDWLSCRACV